MRRARHALQGRLGRRSGLLWAAGVDEYADSGAAACALATHPTRAARSACPEEALMGMPALRTASV